MDVLAAAAAAAPVADAPSQQRLTEKQRWSCVAWHEIGWSNKKIAEHLGVHRNTVRNILAREAAVGSPNSGSRSGRPRCTDEALDTAIAFTAHVDVFSTPRQIKRKLQLDDISPRTIDRRLQAAGLFGRIARHKRDYAPEEVAARLAFAQRYQAWTVEQWSSVLFSDEKCFWGQGFCGRTHVRRPMGQAFNPIYCVNKTAHPVKVNAWGCFSAEGPGYLHIFYEKLDSELYVKILRDNLKDVAKRDFPSPNPPAIRSWHFLQDNAPMHKAGIAKEWLHNNGVSVLDFPPYSPDLNPIENLWAIMAREVEKKQCEDDEALGDAVLEVWDAVDPKVYRDLASSMPERCQAVIDAHGWHTKY
jgi:transposase